MVDLLGRKRREEEIGELRSKVALLEEERDSLALQIERRDEKIRKMTAAQQEASLALKAAEQRIAALQEEGSEDGGEEKGRPKPEEKSWTLKPREVARLLDRLDEIRSKDDDLLSALVPAGSMGSDLHPGAEEMIRRAGSDRGVAVFSDPLLFTIGLVPPFPIKKEVTAFASTFRTGPLREMLDTPVLVVAVHAGETLLGLALGREGFIEEAVVKSTVKEKHTKGGWSQRRFERLREEDIRQHAALVSERLESLLEGRRSIPVYAVVGGESALVRMIRPAIEMPILEAKFGRIDRKDPAEVLEEVYAFSCLRG